MIHRIKEWDAPLLTLHFHKGESKQYIIKKTHAVLGACFLAACISAGAYGVHRYQNTKQELAYAWSQISETEASVKSLQAEKAALLKKAKELEDENAAYNSQISVLEQKANDIEAKIAALNQSKQELYEKLEGMDQSSAEPSTTQAAAAPPSGAQASATHFTPYVFTPYNTVHTRTAMLNAKLEKLSADTSAEETALINVAEDVTETLARVASKPSIWPVRGIVTSEFCYRSDPINGSSAFHTGMDISCPIGTPIRAAASGTVLKSEYNNSGYGYMVEISHGNGYTTLYAHNSSLAVAVGDYVSQGDVIAYSGATGRVTGPHSHYEVKRNGELQNPRDYLK